MKRAGALACAALLAIVALATVSWSSGAALRLTDEGGAAAAGAYVQYHYVGYLVDFVHPVDSGATASRRSRP